MLYGTTRRFLEVFGLESLKSLPSLRELKELADQRGVELPGELAEDGAGEASVAVEAEDATDSNRDSDRESDPDPPGVDGWEPPEIVEAKPE